MWLKRKAVLNEGEQGCIKCSHYNPDDYGDEWRLWCAVGRQVYDVHGIDKLYMWVTNPESPNNCSFFNPDPDHILNYKYKKWKETRVTGSKNMWIKKADDQVKMGIEVEKEHAPTVAKIQASIKDGKITMSDEDIYKSIAQDHLNEFGDYYTRLAKMESEAKAAKGTK